VVGKGGAFTPLELLTKFGAGARFGSGEQVWPWISLHDEAAALVHLLTSSISGPVNLAGPTAANADRVTRELARRLGRGYRLRVPGFAIGMLGDAGRQLLLADQHEVPSKLLMDGFEFRHETVASAIDAAF
jgi:NAD dependent epimerase/dehydratase family enzyme